MEKSPDAFRTISEVADELDLPQHVLRFWETRFQQIKPMKRGGGRRYYRPEDVDLLKGIRHLLYDHGYTIKGVQKLLKANGNKFVAAIASGDLATVEALAASSNEEPAPPKAGVGRRTRSSAVRRHRRAGVLHFRHRGDDAEITVGKTSVARKTGRYCRKRSYDAPRMQASARSGSVAGKGREGGSKAVPRPNSVVIDLFGRFFRRLLCMLLFQEDIVRGRLLGLCHARGRDLLSTLVESMPWYWNGPGNRLTLPSPIKRRRLQVPRMLFIGLLLCFRRSLSSTGHRSKSQNCCLAASDTIGAACDGRAPFSPLAPGVCSD